MITIPVDVATKAHLGKGTPVELTADESTGEVRIQPLAPRTRPDFARLMVEVAEEDRELLDRLAEYDRNRGQ